MYFKNIIIQTGKFQVNSFPTKYPPSTSLLSHLPGSFKMHVCVGSLTIGGEEEVCGVLLRQPSNLIDLLLDLQTLKVVELGLMALKGAVDIVLSLGEWLSLALRKEKEVRENVGREMRSLAHMYNHSAVSTPRA